MSCQLNSCVHVQSLQQCAVKYIRIIYQPKINALTIFKRIVLTIKALFIITQPININELVIYTQEKYRPVCTQLINN